MIFVVQQSGPDLDAAKLQLSFGAADQTLRSRSDELTLAFLGLLLPTRRFQEAADGQGFQDALVA